MARVEVLLPQWGMGMSEGTITAWLKSIGDSVAEDEALADIEAEKVTETLESPASGTLVEILVPEGDTVEVRTPEEYMGDVIGDINSRRGMIQSMEDATGVKVVRALVPLSEMFGYVGDLRSKTQGRAVYSMQFDSYAEVPRNVAEEIIKKTRGE